MKIAELMNEAKGVSLEAIYEYMENNSEELEFDDYEENDDGRSATCRVSLGPVAAADVKFTMTDAGVKVEWRGDEDEEGSTTVKMSFAADMGDSIIETLEDALNTADEDEDD